MAPICSDNPTSAGSVKLYYSTSIQRKCWDQQRWTRNIDAANSRCG